MRYKRLFIYLLALASWSLLSCAHATLDEDIDYLQTRWAQIKYQVDDADERIEQMDQLIETASQVTARYPDRAEPKIWQAMILATQAEQKVNLSSLTLGAEARDLLLEAEKIDPYALNGAVYTSLGLLYTYAPPWPFSFGNDKTAEKYFKKALERYPDDIDTNFYYALFLRNQKEREQALEYYQKAYDAPSRENRELADAGRREEISQAIEELQMQIKEQPTTKKTERWLEK